MKLLTLTLAFYANIMPNGQEFQRKLMRESNFIALLQYILSNNLIIEDQEEINSSLARLIEIIAKQDDNQMEDGERAEIVEVVSAVAKELIIKRCH